MKNIPVFRNLTDLAEFLKTMDNSSTAKIGFDMRVSNLNHVTNHPCGSACCIGGWAILGQGVVRTSISLAVQMLQPDLDLKECLNLCYPEFGNVAAGYKATPQQAARAVEILRDTGKCDWNRALQEAC